MQRHGARHAQASLTSWIKDYLDGLVTPDYAIGENLGQSELAGAEPKSAGLSRQIWVTVAGRSLDAATELGGGNRETRYDAVIDILGAPAPSAKALAEDVFELLSGFTSAGNYLPFIDQVTGDPVVGEQLWLETAAMDQASPKRNDWYQVSAELWRSYIPGG